MINNIPKCVSEHYEDGAYYAGKCLVRVNPNFEGEFIVKDGTVCILASAFEGCTKIGDVKLPDTIEYIGTRAFANSSVTSVKLPVGLINHNNNIEAFTFYGCDQLKTVTFGEGVTLNSINTCAFMDCSNLEGFDFTKVNTLKFMSFAGAFNPEKNVSIVLRPEQINSSDHDTTTQFPHSGIKSVEFIKNIGEYHNTIPSGCFYECTNLSSVKIGPSVKVIGPFCFDGCTSLSSDILAFNECNVTQLCYRCLARTSLTEITIPVTLSSFDSGVFSNNPTLKTLNWKTKATFDIPLFSFLNDVSKEGSQNIITNYSNSSCNYSDRSANKYYVKQPEKNRNTFITTLNLYPSQEGSVNYGAIFSFQPYLETVNIHNSENSEYGINACMFSFCPVLSTVTFDHPEKVTAIGSLAFEFCPGLHSFPFESLTNLESIDALAFMLTSDGVGYSNKEVTNWEKDDPRRNYGLMGEIDLSKCEKLSQIDACAFQDQFHITSVKLPKNVNLLASVFIGC